jgi:hypothetical protein
VHEHVAADRVAGQVAPRTGRDVDVAVDLRGVNLDVRALEAAPGVPGTVADSDIRCGNCAGQAAVWLARGGERCATAVGEGAMAVQFVHGRLAESARIIIA